jgi:hypothetical protein
MQLEYMNMEDAYRKTLGEAEPYMNQAMNFGILGSNTGSGLTLGQLDKSTYDAYAQAVTDSGSDVAPLGFEEWETAAGEVATKLNPMLVNIQGQQKGLQKYRDDFTKRKIQGAATVGTSDDYIGNIQSIGREGDIARSNEVKERITLLDNKAKTLEDNLGASTNLSTEFADWQKTYKDYEDKFEAASKQYDDGDDNKTSKEFAAQARQVAKLLENSGNVAGISSDQLTYLAIKGTQDAIQEGNLNPQYFGAIDGEKALKRAKYYLTEYHAHSKIAKDTERQISNLNKSKATLMAIANQFTDIHSPMTK